MLIGPKGSAPPFVRVTAIAAELPTFTSPNATVVVSISMSVSTARTGATKLTQARSEKTTTPTTTVAIRVVRDSAVLIFGASWGRVTHMASVQTTPDLSVVAPNSDLAVDVALGAGVQLVRRAGRLVPAHAVHLALGDAEVHRLVLDVADGRGRDVQVAREQ